MQLNKHLLTQNSLGIITYLGRLKFINIFHFILRCYTGSNFSCDTILRESIYLIPGGICLLEIRYNHHENMNEPTFVTNDDRACTIQISF